MRVCINTWGLYNEGRHLGTWCDLEDYESILEELQELEGSEDIEPYLADWEEDVLGVCSEHAHLEGLASTYREYEELDEQEQEAVQFLMKGQGYDLEYAIAKAEDVQCYDVESYEALAIMFIEEGLYGEGVMNLWETNSMYLDTEYMGRELQYDYTEHNGKYWRCD